MSQYQIPMPIDDSNNEININDNVVVGLVAAASQAALQAHLTVFNHNLV